MPLSSIWACSGCGNGRLLLRSTHANLQLAAAALHFQLPWLAADFAIFDHDAGGVWVDVNGHVFAAVRTSDGCAVFHGAQGSLLCAD
jgi:hypothetical protein